MNNAFWSWSRREVAGSRGAAARLGLVGVVLLGLWGSLAAQTARGDDSLDDLLRQAERILIVRPEKRVDVSGGEQFLVEIVRVLRGSGQKGQLARVINSGNTDTHPRFDGGEQYVFFLKDNRGGAGWFYLGSAAFGVKGGNVAYTENGERKTLPLEMFEDRLAKIPFDRDAFAPRESVAGKWGLFITEEGDDVPLWSAEITGEGEKFSVEYGQNSAVSRPAILKAGQATAKSVDLSFELAGQTFRFEGSLQHGKIYGAIRLGDDFVIPARMLPVEQEFRTVKPRPTLGKDAFAEALQADDKAAPNLSRFIALHRDSPLVFDAFRELISRAKTAMLPENEISELVQDAIKTAKRWSPVIESRIKLDLAVALSRQQLADTLVEQHLAELRKADEKLIPRSMITASKAESMRRHIRKGESTEAIALLEELHKGHPYEPEFMYLLAGESQKTGATDRAIELYSQIVALPMLERVLMQVLAQGKQGGLNLTGNPAAEFPRQKLNALWTKKHGDLQKIEAHLDHVFEEKLVQFTRHKVSPREASAKNRVVLCELFTGAACPPCVGADAASVAIETTYPRSDVIVLRYHQHIPAPDPLANGDGEQRMGYYQLRGTPGLLINGTQTNAGGFLSHAEGLYRGLCATIDKQLATPNALGIKLAGKQQGETVTYSAVVEGLPEERTDLVLRVVLAEEKVRYVGSNGIRFHEMLVRAMPGGVPGVKATAENGLSQAGKLELDDLRTELMKGIERIEGQAGEKFDSKPVDLKKLHLVAFVQNELTKEVLQAHSVAVTVTEPTDGEKKPVDKPAKPEDKSDEKPTKPAKAETKSDEKPSTKPDAKPTEEKPEAKKSDE